MGPLNPAPVPGAALAVQAVKRAKPVEANNVRRIDFIRNAINENRTKGKHDIDSTDESLDHAFLGIRQDIIQTPQYFILCIAMARARFAT